MKKESDLILEDLYNLLQKKSIKDIIDFEFDNIYNKSAISKLSKITYLKTLFITLILLRNIILN